MSALLSGITVGFAVAMPVGPIGILCIKRSLQDGFRYGLATGLGAASADASYGVLVALGLGLSGLLAQAQVLQLAGGGLIIALGLLSLRSFFKRNPTAEISAPKGGLATAWFSTYLLTLANPMTVLAFVGLIAALGSASAAGPYLLVVGVFIGSLLWWLILVGGVLMVKSRLPVAAFRWLDFASGMVLVVWGGVIILNTNFL
ncbi:MAG TPA: LysE family translocator [Rhodobacteraceae bacterium]|nr:LysE family translocator [Paracoccaceae bacterium]